MKPVPLSPNRARAFILENTRRVVAPLVPEIPLQLADEAHGLWQRTESELQAIGLPPPFWAFAWAGGQALARHILDHPERVAGKHIADFASGSGLVAIAAMRARAETVEAFDIDPFAIEAVAVNAELNGVRVSRCGENRIGSDMAADVLLAGDVFFDRGMAEAITPWLDRLAASGIEVLVGDPGRSYLPTSRLTALARYDVPVTRALEDVEMKPSTVWRWVA